LGKIKEEESVLDGSFSAGIWNEALGATSKTGVKKFHSFRRTAARDKRAAGVDTSVIMEGQGWKTDALFRRYAIVDRADKLDSQRKLERFQDETRTKIAQFEDASQRSKEQVE